MFARFITSKTDHLFKPKAAEAWTAELVARKITITYIYSEDRKAVCNTLFCSSKEIFDQLLVDMKGQLDSFNEERQQHYKGRNLVFEYEDGEYPDYDAVYQRAQTLADNKAQS